MPPHLSRCLLAAARRSRAAHALQALRAAPWRYGSHLAREEGRIGSHVVAHQSDEVLQLDGKRRVRQEVEPLANCWAHALQEEGRARERHMAVASGVDNPKVVCVHGETNHGSGHGPVTHRRQDRRSHAREHRRDRRSRASVRPRFVTSSQCSACLSPHSVSVSCLSLSLSRHPVRREVARRLLHRRGDERCRASPQGARRSGLQVTARPARLMKCS